MEPMIRGYSVNQQLTFIQTQYEPDVSRKLLDQIPEDVRKALDNLTPAGWYPRHYSVCLLRAIASQHEDEQSAYDDLVRCGTFIAEEATNTFLRILMKMLTPALFAKKIPDFWKRDQKGGYIEVDTANANSGRMKLKLCDVEGFDHIGVISIGWMTFGMKSMGKDDVVVKQEGWSLNNPGPKEVSYELSWS